MKSQDAFASILCLFTMNTKVFCLVYFQILYFLPSVSITTLSGNETDHLALLAFKSMILEDPQGAFSSWNDSSHYCQWDGVTCGLRHRRATVLDLHSRGLVGSLSPFIGNMSFLQKIWLGNNTIHGRIPQEIDRLGRLQTLGLHGNFFEGEIPVNLSHCSSLTFLALAGNKLVGEIPEDFGSFSKLTDLWLHFNNLTKIPPSIGNITSLQTLAVVSNNLMGTLPDTIGQLKNLRQLDLGANYLSGVIPPSIYNLSLITVFSVPYNKLEGTLPPDIGFMMPHLQALQLSGNYFSGTLPFSLSNSSNLIKIDIPYNYFSGKVTVNFASLQNLWGVVLGGNNFGSGQPDEFSFLSSLANCSDLHVIELSENQLKGDLPYDISNFSTKLFYLSIGRNHISGEMPSWIGNLFKLSQLLLSENELTGRIPSNIGNLYQLQRVELYNNKLSGEIPISLGNLSLLNELHLSNNILQGNIPPSLGRCTNLSLLDLSQNNLSGVIPDQILGISTLSVSLNLSRNRLSGTLPSAVGKLVTLSELDVSENDLSAEIPDAISNCISLEKLYLQGNLFEGPIPPSLRYMRGLRIIDFSRNNLSGEISLFLQDLSLSYLNLSHNNFEGKVPMGGVFANASTISVASNNRLCGGISELDLPTCKINVMKRKMSHVHLALVITASCAIFSLIFVSTFLYFWLKRKKRLKSTESLLKEPFSNLSYGELLKATDGFSSANLIGAGSFASVYKGMLLSPEDKVVAVKVLNLQRRGASRSFLAECEALRNIRHRNLVRVITACSSVDFQGNDFKALVYDFMPKGNLDLWLHSRREGDREQEREKLSLHQRLSIAIDVACAVDYLHNHCETPIIHCDLKPSNVLLDEDTVAHVGDFGLAKFIYELSDRNDFSSLGIRGTIGYAAPEYGVGSEVSAKGDVYSFGILVLEMITGKRPTDPMFKGGLNLHSFAKMSLAYGVSNVLDPMILNNIEEHVAASNTGDNLETLETYDNPEHVGQAASSSYQSENENKEKECLVAMLRIGVACSQESPEDRMDMSDVVIEMHSIRRIIL